MCILPDALHNSCPNVLDWSDEPSTHIDAATDANVTTRTATSSHWQSRKLFRKEDSGMSQHNTNSTCSIVTAEFEVSILGR